jgi:tetratricopeptide (TPR) repeat protein
VIVLASVLCAAVLLTQAPRVRPVERDPLHPVLKEALATYRGGDFWGTLARLGTIDDAKLDDAVETLWIHGGLSQDEWVGRIRTAIVMLTEAWFVRNQKGPSLDRDPYLRAAQQLASGLVRLADDHRHGIGSAERRFARDWYLLVVSYRHGNAQIGWSRAYLAEARQRFPKDPEVLVASGADHEMVSETTRGYLLRVDAGGATVGESSIDPEEELEQAEGYLRQAAALAPKLVEARLRLGRVLYRRGDLAGSARELQAALSLTAQDQVRYLASTFLGLVAVARGDLDEAERFYVEALRLVPGGQSATIARSEAAYLRGRPADAAGMIVSLLQDSRTNDPWWLYLVGDWWHFEARLLALRSEVRR